ncbi:MAG: tRNA (N6-threonylcarbamoyladenosine(37)-N6)-methyltransferase TrmO [Candidatus Kariarchaeaceae archaeon]
MASFEFVQLGVIHSPFKQKEGLPIQSAFSKEKGVIEVFDQYLEGLDNLDEFSHIIILYLFHEALPWKPRQKPFLSDTPKGLFSIRSPNRPNPIGFSVVRLLKIEENKLIIEGIDVLDKTPLLDIKPYVPDFDSYPRASQGWLNGKICENETPISDTRFS